MLFRALSVFGLVMVGAGLVLLLAVPLPGTSRETFAASLAGVVPAASPASTPTVGPTSEPPATRTPAVTPPAPATSTIPPTVAVLPTRTPLPPPPTPTPIPAPTRAPSSPTPTPTLPVCPTATPVRILSVPPRPAPTPTPSPAIPVCRTPTPTPTPTPRLGQIAPPGLAALSLFAPLWLAQTPLGTNLRFDLAYPRQMTVGTSDTITLSIVRTADGSIATITLTPNVVNLAATPLPLGTPGVSILEARGQNYDVFAAAAVSSSDLEMVRNNPLSEEQSLDQQTSSWSWAVNPRLAGSNRRAQLVVELRYRPRPDTQGSAYARSVWVQGMSIDVREKDALVLGPIAIPTSSLGPTLVQAGISSQVPLLIAWFKRKLTGGSDKEKPPRRQKKKNPS